ncbi:unnamed protein product [Closterium sp. Yama58-4]|nr:unnamed protein product [Closterium sp. Yama58-4]
MTLPSPASSPFLSSSRRPSSQRSSHSQDLLTSMTVDTALEEVSLLRGRAELLSRSSGDDPRSARESRVARDCLEQLDRAAAYLRRASTSLKNGAEPEGQTYWIGAALTLTSHCSTNMAAAGAAAEDADADAAVAAADDDDDSENSADGGTAEARGQGEGEAVGGKPASSAEVADASSWDSTGGMHVARFKTREEVMRNARNRDGGRGGERPAGDTTSGSLATTQIIGSNGWSGGSKRKNNDIGPATCGIGGGGSGGGGGGSNQPLVELDTPVIGHVRTAEGGTGPEGGAAEGALAHGKEVALKAIALGARDGARDSAEDGEGEAEEGGNGGGGGGSGGEVESPSKLKAGPTLRYISNALAIVTSLRDEDADGAERPGNPMHARRKGLQVEGRRKLSQRQARKAQEAREARELLTSSAAAKSAARPAWVRGSEYGELRELQRFMRTHYARAEELLAGNLTAHWEANRGRRLAAVGAKLPRLKPDFIVSKTGKPGHCRTVQEAATKLIAAYKAPPARFVVYIMKGTYAEKVLLNKNDVIFLGDGARDTIITYGASVGKGYTAFDSASVGVNADGFTAMGITVVNNAGSAGGQAIALRTEGDKSAFYDCVFLGHQDTLAPDVGRQYFRNCTVRGTIDFVFGVAAAVFEDCTFIVRRSPPGYSSTVAAQGRVTLKDPSAFVFLRGKVVGESAGQYAYLARPWWPYSRTIFLQTYLSQVVVPAGWLEWSDATTKTIWGGRPYFAEYDTTGPGAKGRRVAWARPGKVTANQAQGFMPSKLLQLGTWVRDTKIPYNP